MPLCWQRAAISRTLARAGPRRASTAKLKVNPMIKAVIGDMASISSLKGSLCSLSHGFRSYQKSQLIKSKEHHQNSSHSGKEKLDCS